MLFAAPALPRLVLLCGSLTTFAALAQQPAASPRDDVSPPSGQTEQAIERLRHDDAGARIDELRVGGESKSITVKPKGDAQAYEVAHKSNNSNPAGTERDRSGPSGWKFLKF